MKRVALEVRPSGENSMARFYRVAPADSPNAFCTVRVHGSGNMCCLTDLYDPKCAHIKAVRAYLADAASDQPAASAAAA